MNQINRNKSLSI